MPLLKRMILRRIVLVAVTIGLSILTIAATLWWNTQLSSIINLINRGDFISQEKILIAIATVLISACMAFLLSLCSDWTCETMAHDLRMGYASYFASLSYAEIEEHNAGEQLSKLQNEISDVSAFLRANLFSIVNDLVKFVCTFTWMLLLSPKLTILSNLPVMPILLYTAYSSKVIGKAALRSQQANARMSGFTETLITVFPIVRLFDASDLIRGKYNATLDEWEDAVITEERKKAGLMSLSGVLSYVPLLFLFIIGGTMVIHNEIPLGTMYVFINLSENVSGVLMNIPGRIAMFRRFAANMERLQPYVKL